MRNARDWYAQNKDRIRQRRKELAAKQLSRQSVARKAEYRKRRVSRGLSMFPSPLLLTEEERQEHHRVASRDYSRRKKGTPLDAPVRDDQGRSPEYYRARYTAHEMKRIAAKKQRTPPWLSEAHLAEIEGMYHFAKLMECMTGRKYHVDHIEPLQGVQVSGLHVPWNLQAIPARDNAAKGNRRVEA